MHIRTIQDFENAINHPYRNGEFLIVDDCIMEVPDNKEDMIDIIENNNDVNYMVNWENQEMYFENGKQVQSVY